MLIDAWKNGAIELASSEEIIEEIKRVLKSFKIRMPDSMIDEWKKAINENSIIVEPKHRINIVKDDQSDNKFIEAAVEAKADFIVSQDRHLLKLKEFLGIRIVTPKQAVESLIKRKTF
ncbi:MAG: putative toxin-antitoxin system toxin component, PIN family [Candidatus Woesearchaeota archaeon]